MKRMSALVCVLVLASFAGAADQTFMPDVDPADGWIQINDGYWERLEDGKLQTVAVGHKGLEQVLVNLQADLVFLVEDYLAAPTDEMRMVLDTHVGLIASVEQGLAKPAAEPKAMLGWCEYDWDAAAGGGKPCYNWASARAAYSGSSAGDCLGLCDLFAYAYVERTLCNDNIISQTASCSEYDVINEECDVYTSLSNIPIKSCYAYSFASISCPDYSYYRSDSATSNSCGFLCPACAIQNPVEER